MLKKIRIGLVVVLLTGVSGSLPAGSKEGSSFDFEQVTSLAVNSFSGPENYFDLEINGSVFSGSFVKNGNKCKTVRTGHFFDFCVDDLEVSGILEGKEFKPSVFSKAINRKDAPVFRFPSLRDNRSSRSQFIYKKSSFEVSQVFDTDLQCPSKPYLRLPSRNAVFFCFDSAAFLVRNVIGPFDVLPFDRKTFRWISISALPSVRFRDQ
jgi:hypothetical protein